MEIAPGCFVTYELKAIDILRSLARVTANRLDAIRRYYEEFVAGLLLQTPDQTNAPRDRGAGSPPRRSARRPRGSWTLRPFVQDSQIAVVHEEPIAALPRQLACHPRPDEQLHRR
jgi:hypothetical protein